MRKENHMVSKSDLREPYAKLELVKHDNLKDITFSARTGSAASRFRHRPHHKSGRQVTT